MYEYQAEVIRVVDGDTVWLDVDLGCDTHIRMSVRLIGINAPEMGNLDGVKSKRWLTERLSICADTLVLRTYKDRKEKYGRYLGELWDSLDATQDPARKSINDQMVEAGFAEVYK